LTNVLRQSTYLIIVTLGQALVLISGGFDLSVGAVIAVTSVVSARYMSSHYADNPNSELSSVLVGVGIGLLVGIVFGLVNGIGVARFKVSPFIMTLGMASVGSGFALYYTGGSPVSGMPPLFTREIGTGRWFEIPVPVYAAILAMILVLFLVGSTAWGRYLYAIGGNENAARMTGVPVDRIKLQAYIVSGLMAALSSVMIVGWQGSAINALGQGYELRVIASTVIGGANLMGGEGGAFGAFIGAALIEVIRNSLLMAGVDSNWQGTFVGVFIVLAVLLERIRGSRTG
jgi:ribose transport system permease protein